jgi:anti-anti-sigma factor
MSMVTSEFNRITETRPNKYLVLDLSQISLIDSNGLGSIVREGQKHKNANSTLYILNPSKYVLKILRETNMINYLPIIDKIDQISPML